MEDFGDLLYIVFAVIGVIYSIFKKNSKKAREATPPIMTEEEDTAYGEIPTFERIFEEESIEKPIQNAPPKKEVMKKTVDMSMEEKKRQMDRNFSRIKSSKVEEESKLEVNDTVHDEIDFDLRRAVIYSEILKRPEYS